MFTKQIVMDQIEVAEHGTIQVRGVAHIMEDSISILHYYYGERRCYQE